MASVAGVYRSLFFPLVWSLTGLLATSFVFRDSLLSGIDRLPGDQLDGRLIMLLHEHWFRVYQGSADWLAVGMFYPVENTLGLSDSFFLSGGVHAIFRFIGLDVYHAYFAQFLALAAIGFTGAYWLFKKRLMMGRWISLALSGLFIVFAPINMGAEYSHIQMYSLWFLPWFVVLASSGWNACSDSKFRVVWGACAGLAYAALLFNAFYVPWFLTLFSGFFVLSYMGFGWLRSRSLSTFFNSDLKQRWIDGRFWFLGFILGFSVAIVPFFLTYLPILQYSQGHGFNVVLQSLPVLTDWFNFGRFSFLWDSIGGIDFDTSNQANKGFGFPLVSGVLTIVAIIYLFAFNKPDGNGLGRPLVVRSLAFALILSWVLSFRICEGSLWWFVYEWVPGGSVIRVVHRYNAVLCLPVLCLWGIVAEDVRQRLLCSPMSSGKGLLIGLIMSPLIVLVFVEQFLVEDTVAMQKWGLRRSDWLDLFASVDEPPRDANFFAVLTDAKVNSAEDFSLQLDAWSLAQRWGLKTVNGHSGIVPPGYRLFDALAVGGIESYWSALTDWSYRKELGSDLYLLNLDSGKWDLFASLSEARVPEIGLGERIPFGRADGDWTQFRVERALAYGWSGPELSHTWTDGKKAALVFVLKEPQLGRNLMLSIDAFAYVSAIQSEQRFELRLNGVLLDSVTISHHMPARTYRFEIPAERVDSAFFRLEVSCLDAISPASAEGIGDPRLLGLGIVGLTIIAE